MFGITHWIIVLLIALIVFGPEKLPELARNLGRVLAEFRRASTDFRRVIEEEMEGIERQTRERALQAAIPPAPALPEPAGVIAASPAATPQSEPVLEAPLSPEGHADRS